MNRTNRPKASTVLAVVVAGIATVNAYQAMVAFAVDMLGMDKPTAYATAGVFELSLFTVAVLAREAAKDNRPTGVLLTLTWVLSGASGIFAAIHEADLGHGVGAVLFRITVPTLAALMWHLALIGERHLATGTTWADARRQRAMQAMYEAAEEAFRLAGARGAKRAQRRYRAALHRARRVSPPAVMIHQTQQWDAASAAETATILTARANHGRQMAAFTNRQVDAPAPRPATSSTTPTAPTASAPVATVRPAPAPVAVPVAVPVYAQTTTDTTPVATPATSDARKCLGCGNPLPADARPNARYCSRKNPDGTRDQSCKNRYHAAQQRAKSQRATLAATVDAMTQQRTAAAAFA
jgi:hypothetical protein